MKRLKMTVCLLLISLILSCVTIQTKTIEVDPIIIYENSNDFTHQKQADIALLQMLEYKSSYEWLLEQVRGATGFRIEVIEVKK